MEGNSKLMKLKKLKLWHLILSVWIIILLVRFELLIQTAQLFWYSIILFFNDHNFFTSHLNFQLIDSFFSLLTMALIPALISISKFRRSIFCLQLNFSRSFLVLLLFSFFIPSLITREHPELQKNISEIKLLPPFSIIYEIDLKTEKYFSGNSANEKFLALKEKVLLKEFDENKIFIKKYSADNHHYKIYMQNSDFLIPSDSIKVIKSQIVLLGTDEFGRDVFSRLIFGARISIFIGIMAVLISLLLGLVLGFFASTKSHLISVTLNRLADLFLSFPSIFFVILILALFGNNLFSVIAVLGFSGWMSLYKIVSSEVATVKQKDYFILSERIGLNNFELLLKEILPVIMVPIVVNLVFQFSNVILAESALSFLGLGSGNEYPSWGSMIEKGQEYINIAWWMVLIPGLMLVLTLLSIHNIAKELNKYFNPKIS